MTRLQGAALVPMGSALGAALLRRGRVTPAPSLAASANPLSDLNRLFGRRAEAAEILLPLPSPQYLLRSSDVPAAVAPRHAARAGLLQVQASLTLPPDPFDFAAARLAQRADARGAHRVLVCAARRAGLAPPPQLGLDRWSGLIRWVPDALVLWQALAGHLSQDQTATLVLHCVPPDAPQLLSFRGPALERHSTLPGSTLQSPALLAAELQRAAREMPEPPRLLLASTMPEPQREALGQALAGITVERVGPTDPAGHVEWLAQALAAATDRHAWRPPPIAFVTSRRMPRPETAPGMLASARGLAAATWAAALLLAGTGLAAHRGTRAAQERLAAAARTAIDLESLPRGAELATIRNVANEELEASRPLFAAAAPSLLEVLQIAHATSVSLASVEWRGFDYAAPSITIHATGPEPEIGRWAQVLRLAWPHARVLARPGSGRAQWSLDILFAPAAAAP